MYGFSAATDFAFAIGVQLRALGVDGGLGAVPVLLLFEVQHDVGVGHMVEVFLDAPDFLGHIVAQGVGNLDLLAAYIGLHDISTCVDSDKGLSLAGRRYIQRLPVFCDCPARDMDALFGKDVGDRAVADRLERLFRFDQLLDERANGGG